MYHCYYPKFIIIVKKQMHIKLKLLT